MSTPASPLCRAAIQIGAHPAPCTGTPCRAQTVEATPDGGSCSRRLVRRDWIFSRASENWKVSGPVYFSKKIGGAA